MFCCPRLNAFGQGVGQLFEPVMIDDLRRCELAVLDVKTSEGNIWSFESIRRYCTLEKHVEAWLREHFPTVADNLLSFEEGAI